MPLLESRYARALVDLAVSRGKLDEFEEQLLVVNEVFISNKDLQNFLSDPRVKADAKKSFLSKTFKESLEADVLTFLQLLVDKERTSLLPGILPEYIAMADMKRKTLNILIASAFPISIEQQSVIAEKYRKLYGAMSANLETRIEPELLGGIKVTIGDKVYDKSIKRSLEALKEMIIK